LPTAGSAAAAGSAFTSTSIGSPLAAITTGLAAPPAAAATPLERRRDRRENSAWATTAR
jgi:hypothetical protein